MLTGEDVMNVILIYSTHSSPFFTEIMIGLSGNDPIVFHQLEVCTKDAVTTCMKASGQTLLMDADLHKSVLNLLNITVSRELKSKVSRDLSVLRLCHL
jgi:hypothetical protein